MNFLELYNFTALGATGRIGPDSNAGYRGIGLRDVLVTDGKQEWQVPITGKFHVEACGASGGDEIERQSRYNDHHFEQLNEQLLLVIVSYIIYNIFFFFVMLCYFLLY